MELQQGWQRRNDSNDDRKGDKETTNGNMPVYEDVNEQQDVQAAREDEVNELLTNRSGGGTKKASVKPREGSGSDSGENSRTMLNNSSGTYTADANNNTQESDDRSRPSFEIDELLAQRFGSIRR